MSRNYDLIGNVIDHFSMVASHVGLDADVAGSRLA